jgi:ATP-dependent DNA helicase RecG
MEWSFEEVWERLQLGDECQRIEAKEARNSLGKSALETVAAFVNEPDLGGGYLLLGVKRNEENYQYQAVGVDDPDKIQCELTTACATHFNRPIRPKIHIEVVDGKKVVVAFIQEEAARNKPIYMRKGGIEGGSYRRIGSSDLRCTADDLDLLYLLRRDQPYEEEVIRGTS